MIDDRGREWLESNYQGYGEFGGADFYAVLDVMNGGDGDRNRGIKLAFGSKPVKRPKIVEADCDQRWQDLPDSEICPDQGYFYNEEV
jgi:hypothetical protein